MDNRKLFSIIIICENEKDNLARCFESILNQTYQNIEVIFTDNDSSDKSYELALSYSPKFKEKDMFIKVAQNKKKYNYHNNIKITRGHIEGEFLYYMPVNVVLDKYFVERVVRKFEEENLDAIVCSQVQKINGNIINERITTKETYLNKEGFIIHPDLWRGQIICKVTWFPMLSNHMTTFNYYRNNFEVFLFYCFCKVGVIEEVLVESIKEVERLTDIEHDMMEIFEYYTMYLAFKEKIKTFGSKVSPEVWEKALNNLVKKCIAKAIRVYSFGEKLLAQKYLQLASVFDITVSQKEYYVDVSDMIKNEVDLTTKCIDWCINQGEFCIGRD